MEPNGTWRANYLWDELRFMFFVAKGASRQSLASRTWITADVKDFLCAIVQYIVCLYALVLFFEIELKLCHVAHISFFFFFLLLFSWCYFKVWTCYSSEMLSNDNKTYTNVKSETRFSCWAADWKKITARVEPKLGWHCRVGLVYERC